MFSKKDTQNLSPEDFAKKYPEIAKALSGDGKFKAENEKLKAQLKIQSDNDKIKAYAKTLQLVEEGDICIEAEMSLAEASVHLLEIRTNMEEVLTDSVRETSSEAAGVAPKKTESDDKPKTINEAIHFIKERDKLSSLKDAMEKVKVEFPELLKAVHKVEGYKVD